VSLDFSIQSIRPAAIATESALFSQQPRNNTSETFQKFLASAMNDVEKLRTEAHAQINQFLAGEQEDPHKMILAVQNADLAFQMFLQVRNKFTQAYQEVMRMQL
jgi:flagellar hook-basal body complex protein FliE